MFQDIFETRKQSFTSAFSICMTVPLKSTGLIFYHLQYIMHKVLKKWKYILFHIYPFLTNYKGKGIMREQVLVSGLSRQYNQEF